jgi:hypothetical protein
LADFAADYRKKFAEMGEGGLQIFANHLYIFGLHGKMPDDCKAANPCAANSAHGGFAALGGQP